MGQFALGDAVGPVAEILVGCAAELARRDVDHQLAGLSGLGAADPGLFAGFEIPERLRDRARGQLAELMAADAAIVLDQIEPIELPDTAGDVAVTAELVGARDLH